MQIDFYEEFPTKENLEKLKLINFPTTLCIAAKSWEHFEKIKKKIVKDNKNIKFIYWPAVRNTYWVSPFSNTEDLIEFFKQLDGKKHCILIDLEFPMKNKKMIFKNLLTLRKNKKIIREFIIKNKKYVILAVYPLCFGIGKWVLKVLGLEYNIKIKRKPMFYTSSFRQNKINFLLNHFYKGFEKMRDKDEFVLGLGVIAKGRLTKEILNFEELERDLKFAKNSGFKEVIIFRVGGLNKEYMKIIEKFI